MSLRLSPTQKRIVEHGDGALLVVAGPGAGKTRVLTERIRRLLTEINGHFRVLALTFTNKAANEMKERLAEFPDIEQRAFIGTLHSFCMEVLANRGKAVGIDSLPTVFERDQDRTQILHQAVMEDPALQSLFIQSGDFKEREKLLQRWLEMIRYAKNNLQLPEMLDAEISKKVYEAYDSGLRASGALDFDDLLILTYRLFEERPKIADFYQRLYRYICVDEAQDLNYTQYQLIRALCGDNYRNVMMVGDPKQAIFGFNGASPKYLEFFERDFKAIRIPINENFRSSQAVVQATQALNPEYQVEGQLPIRGSLELLVGIDEAQEATLVLEQLQQLVNNGHPDIEGRITFERCALLGRNRYVFSAIEDELKNRNWPYYKYLSLQHESESDLFRDFELCLRVLANPRDQLHLGMLLNRWGIQNIDECFENMNQGGDLLAILNDKATTRHQCVIADASRAMNWTGNDFNFLAAIDCIEAYTASLESQDEQDLILQDTSLWRKHWDSFLRSEPGNQHSLISFLSKVALGSTQQPYQAGLALLTVHSAKGLEFDVVFVMGMAEGTLPDYRAKDSHALEEEKRNVFVAISRSRRLLFFSYPKTRIMPWGAIRQQTPSRYLKTIGLI